MKSTDLAQRKPDTAVDTLYVRYDGEALRTHEMDVKQLAPALLSLAKAFDIMQKGVAPEARVRLNAQATREGSFTIDLLLHFVNEAEGLLTGDDVTAVLNASGLMAIYFGAVRLIKRFALHVKPAKTEDAGQDENGLDLVDITFPDGSRMRELKASVDALRNPELVKAVKGVFAPTLEDGIDLVQFQSGTRDETVRTEEADAISHYDPAARESSEDTVEIVIQALDVSFRENGKWRITDGIKTQFVTIEDEQFKKRVLDGDEAMRANDIYRVDMRVEKSLDENNRLMTRYVSIVRVHEHRSIGEQLTLF
ncbi:hypothetical protein [Bifidobacterium vansinderenii]|uniref:Uncharacterized protein n=1 Tax=Bifidobacterium vansinderenii TaxID=1984871 RepID=A0A229W0N9_9BIFI|nr:hypothetical protein [Bifidobacterium vansinderenii]OXN01220.1 hypothetical protein Tam10B_0220 [Bifidobacterium vansinderenii]